MKKIIIVVLIGSVIVALAFLAIIKKPEIYEREVEKLVTQEVKVDQLKERIENAINASSTATEEKAKKAYEETKKQTELEIELSVRAEYRKELEAEEKELMEEVSF